MALYRDEGVVLRTLRLGEADRIVTFATPEHGKVRAVAKGVRRVKSRIGARVEPMCHVTLLCWRGRDLDVVTGIEILDSFATLRTDLDRLLEAMTMLEIVDQVAVEQQGMREIFALLVGALRTLEARPSAGVLGAFCFKLLALEGVGPVVDRCARCDDGAPLVAFDAGEGGLLCPGCRRGQAVGPRVVELLQLVLGGRLTTALAISEEDPSAASELERLGIATVEHHLERRLKARHQLDGRSLVRSGDAGALPPSRSGTAKPGD